MNSLKDACREMVPGNKAASLGDIKSNSNIQKQNWKARKTAPWCLLFETFKSHELSQVNPLFFLPSSKTHSEDPIPNFSREKKKMFSKKKI